MKILYKILLIVTFGLTSIAQTIYFNEDSTIAAFWNNRLYFPFNNKGILADVNVQPVGSLMKYDSIGVVFSGGFYLSGYSDTTLWGNGVITLTDINDYAPGIVGSNKNDPANQIYATKKDDPEFGLNWQHWSDAVKQGAYFYDGDEDGKYNPVDLNRNNKWDSNEDKPDLLYDVTFFTTYNDGVPASERRDAVDPMGIEVRQTIFASNQNTILDDVIFIRYSILYKGLNEPGEPDSLSDVIFSAWSDPDIGVSIDDLVGCDTLLNSGYSYNDPQYGDYVFGSNAPSVFNTIVQGPLIKTGDASDIGYSRKGPDLGEESFIGFKNGRIHAFIPTEDDGWTYFFGRPYSMLTIREYAKGYNRNGDEPDPCNYFFGDVFGGVDCESINPHLMYNGDPVTSYGWVDTLASDFNTLTSTDKFTLMKNEPMDIIVAYVVGRGTDHLNSISRAREITQYVHEEYERNFSTLVGVEDEPEEVVNTFSLAQNYPNPFNPTTTIEYTIPNVGTTHELSLHTTTITVYNILGQKVATLLNEVKAPGSYQVTFDASQLASGVYFYRLTSGAFVQTKKMMVIK